MHAVLSLPDARVRADRSLTRVAILSGVIFFFAGLVKFAFHHWELHAFRSFGLPFPAALEIFAGVVETRRERYVWRALRFWRIASMVSSSITMSRKRSTFRSNLFCLAPPSSLPCSRGWDIWPWSLMRGRAGRG